MLNETQIQSLLDLANSHKADHDCSAMPYLQGEKLSELVHNTSPKKILEIGTGSGFSTLVMALSHPKAFLDTIEKDEDHVEVAKKHFELHNIHPRVNILHGIAESLLPLIRTQYDFIFFDAYGIHYEFLPNYYRLLHDDGTLVVANNHLGSKTSEDFFRELHDKSKWTILEIFDDTTVAKKTLN